MKLRWLCLVLCICVFTPSTTNNHLAASLAVSTATLSGRVTDPNGLVIAGAKVDATNVGTNITLSSETNEEGFFVISNIPPGRYRITIEKQGFQSIVKPDVDLHVQDTVALNFAMQVGSIIQSVMVESGAPLIKTETAEVSTLVDRQFVENMPLNGRSFQSLITLTPGVVLTKAGFDELGQFSINGQRANTNYFMIDGVSANIGVIAGSGLGQSTGGSLPGFSASGGTNNLVSVDALQEFKVQSSTYAPEFGRTPGAQVSIVTRAGTNDFHGTLFEYFRNDVLDANDYFANSRGLPKPSLRQNDFGGVVGGPVLLPRFGEGGRQPWYNGRNRTFFFFSYEGLRLRQPQTGITTVPSLNAREIAPASMQPFLNAFPRPNGRDLANNFSEFNSTFSNPSTLNATSIRIDHTVGGKLTLFARYNRAPSETVQRSGSRRSLNSLFATRFKTQTVTGGATVAISSVINNDFRVNFSRNEGASINLMDNFGGATPPPDSLIFPSFASRQDSLFVFFLSGGTNSGFNLGNNADNLQRQINLVNTVTLIAAGHQLKFGVDYRRLSPIFNPLHYTQQPSFSGVNGAITGTARSVFILANTGQRIPIFDNLSIFGQDTWKVTPRLTLTYGIRWEYNPPPSEKNGRNPFAVTGIDNPSSIALAPAGTPLYRTTYDNFAPRVGAAYQLSRAKARQTVLRGGLGIFYDLGTGQAPQAFGNFPPYAISKTLSNVPFPLSETLAAAPPLVFIPPFGTIFAVDPKLKLPYTYQWNFAIEQSIGASQTVSASYVAAVGRRLLREEILVSPNPTFSAIFATGNGATSDYHAMQLQYQRRLSRGFQALASYTWSHSIDTASNDSSAFVPAARIDPNTDRGPSDFDVRHAFNAAAAYNISGPNLGTIGKAILRNWAVDTIFTARSATPINVLTGADIFSVFSVARPDLIQGIPLYIHDPLAGGGRRINKAAFSLPPVGPDGTPSRQGTLGRNALRGFDVWQVDFALRRQFTLTEKVNLQFKIEFFNLFNHPNFGDPGSLSNGTNVLSNAQFGQSITMLGSSLGRGASGQGFSPLYQIGGPRSIQAVLRIQF